MTAHEYENQVAGQGLRVRRQGLICSARRFRPSRLCPLPFQRSTFDHLCNVI
ncbi:MAG: hypothetical protein KatS3mg058_3339 [Roseiflexus sp.]|nr:MAG: hypothetical protein KatS3mg058_3339 [Roseiflexus sp.]